MIQRAYVWTCSEPDCQGIGKAITHIDAVLGLEAHIGAVHNDPPFADAPAPYTSCMERL